MVGPSLLVKPLYCVYYIKVRIKVYCSDDMLVCSLYRFIKSLASDMSSQLLLAEESIKKADLTPAMDIFSAG